MSRDLLRYDHQTLVKIRDDSKFELSEKELNRLQGMDIAVEEKKSTGNMIGMVETSRSFLATPPLSPSMHPLIGLSALSLGPKHSDEAFRVVSPEDEKGKMIKQIKGCLNKITPEKYDVLASHIVSYFEPSTSNVIIPLIFEKALNELTFAEMYADLFQDLLGKVATCAQSHTTFLMALMLRCNLELTKALQSDEAEARKNSDNPEEDRKALKRSVGISQFIGELFIRDMLKEDFLFKVATKLFHLSETTCENVKQLEAEVACRLIETAGAHWEATYPRFTNDILPRLEDLSEKHPKPRIRFMVLDLMELRGRGWQHRFTKQKPKKLNEGGLLKQGGSRTGSPLNLRDGLASLGLFQTRSTHDPYGESHTFTSDLGVKQRSATPPPTRGLSMFDSFQQRKRGMTPPPQRVMPFMPSIQLEAAPALSSSIGSGLSSPMPIVTSMSHPSSQPPSPAPPIYQHNPYGYTSPQQSPVPSPQPVSISQMQWSDASQTNWQHSAAEEVPHWQQQQQNTQMSWQQEQSLQWQNQDQMGWQSPDSQQWAGHGWAMEQPQSGGQPLTPPLSPPLSPPVLAMVGGKLQTTLPVTGQGCLPVQAPLQTLRQPIPIVEPQYAEQSTGHGANQLGAPRAKYLGEKGPLIASTNYDGRGRRDSPVGRQLPIDASALEMRIRHNIAPEYVYSPEPSAPESMPWPSQRRMHTPPSRALPIEPPINPPETLSRK